MRVTAQQAIGMIQEDFELLAKKHVELVNVHNANVDKLDQLIVSHNQLLKEFAELKKTVQNMNIMF